jgi:toxin secretion/phage lysis holin
VKGYIIGSQAAGLLERKPCMKTFLSEVAKDWQTSSPYIVLLIAIICLDIVFGMTAAWASKTLSSKVSSVGMMKKLLRVFTVVVAALIDGVLPPLSFALWGAELTLTLAQVAAIWWMACEGLSVTENAALLNMPMPKRLRDALLQVKAQLDGEEPEAPTDPESPQPAAPPNSNDQV